MHIWWWCSLIEQVGSRKENYCLLNKGRKWEYMWCSSLVKYIWKSGKTGEGGRVASIRYGWGEEIIWKFINSQCHYQLSINKLASTLSVRVVRSCLFLLAISHNRQVFGTRPRALFRFNFLCPVKLSHLNAVGHQQWINSYMQHCDIWIVNAWQLKLSSFLNRGWFPSLRFCSCCANLIDVFSNIRCQNWFLRPLYSDGLYF